MTVRVTTTLGPPGAAPAWCNANPINTASRSTNAAIPSAANLLCTVPSPHFAEAVCSQTLAAQPVRAPQVRIRMEPVQPRRPSHMLITDDIRPGAAVQFRLTAGFA